MGHGVATWDESYKDLCSSCPNCGLPISTNQGAVPTSARDVNQNSQTFSTEVASLLPFEAKGLMSTVTFDGKFILISRGLMNPLGKGETKIALGSINSIEWRAPISASTSGRVSARPSPKRTLTGRWLLKALMISTNWLLMVLSYLYSI